MAELKQFHVSAKAARSKYFQSFTYECGGVYELAEGEDRKEAYNKAKDHMIHAANRGAEQGLDAIIASLPDEMKQAPSAPIAPASAPAPAPAANGKEEFCNQCGERVWVVFDQVKRKPERFDLPACTTPHFRTCKGRAGNQGGYQR